ncbi:hypothetical protein [Pendulispora albinea]|uniref:Lipoprotein n=1 Tax=Pendulispora albinea TaxID=2741071 RepID=A0ABZ2LZM6_9BACT
MRRFSPRAASWAGALSAIPFALSAFIACSGESTLTHSPTPPDSDAGGPDPAPISDAGARDARPEQDAAAWKPPIACGTELPGPALPPNLTEAEPGYAQELEATDAAGVPDPVDYSGQSKLIRGVVHYMFQEPASEPSVLSHDRAQATENENMGRAFLAAAARGRDGGLSVPFLRRGLYYHYACSRPLPASLDQLRERYGDYRTWRVETMACAKPKNGPRRIYKNSDKGVFVSETLVGDGGIRETEVIFTKLRDDGQLDFAVYTADGQLTDRSSFATNGGGTVTAAAPYICMSCHLDATSGGFTNLRPTGTGAGCKDRDAGP